MASRDRTIVPVTLRVLSVSALVLYVRRRVSSLRAGGPGSGLPGGGGGGGGEGRVEGAHLSRLLLPPRASPLPRTSELGLDALDGRRDRFVELFVARQQREVVADDRVDQLVPDGFDERRPAGQGPVLGRGDQQQHALGVALGAGGVPVFHHFVAERKRVPLHLQLAHGRHLQPVPSLQLQAGQGVVKRFAGRLVEDRRVVDDVALGGGRRAQQVKLARGSRKRRKRERSRGGGLGGERERKWWWVARCRAGARAAGACDPRHPSPSPQCPPLLPRPAWRRRPRGARGPGGGIGGAGRGRRAVGRRGRRGARRVPARAIESETAMLGGLPPS